jgi:hypothetical protein
MTRTRDLNLKEFERLRQAGARREQYCYDDKSDDDDERQ